MAYEQRDIYGKDVIAALADTYQQLFIAPGEGKREKYADIVQCGHDASVRDLSHFRTNEKDSLVYEDTPAGKVPCITLYEREDFVTFLRIMANRCAMAEIPDRQGASIIDGVINWKKIRIHLEEYIEEEKKRGNSDPDEDAEFKRFTSDRSNFRDAVIILSVGPYSAVPGKALGYNDDEWSELSHTIRKYHEITHFICRRLYPDKKDAVWDELVADAVGIYAAFGKFDPDVEKLFLGIEGESYVGGRLENYIKDTDKTRTLNDLSQKISVILSGFTGILADKPDIKPFDAALLLEESMDELNTLTGYENAG